MITTSTPANWRALQSEVDAILRECGFQVEVERVVTTPRGNVEIDVFAEENVRGRTYSIACECKYWQANIPQTIVHGFRTVVTEMGANVGYIVSRNGFQSGSEKAAESTNIRLVTWNEFQSGFQTSWLENHFSPTVTERFDDLVGFTEPLVQTWMVQIPDTEIDVVKELRARYFAIGALCMFFSTYSARLLLAKTHGDRFPNLPLRTSWTNSPDLKEGLPAEILDAAGYRELLGAMTAFAEQGVAEFVAVKIRNGL